VPEHLEAAEVMTLNKMIGMIAGAAMCLSGCANVNDGALRTALTTDPDPCQAWVQVTMDHKLDPQTKAVAVHALKERCWAKMD
jgi:PBP1b-binding outer membrane lipoprotein LpoB